HHSPTTTQKSCKEGVVPMIHDILIVHRTSENPLFHLAPGGKSKLVEMGMDVQVFSQLAVTIVRVLRSAGALERVRLLQTKMAFNVFENLVFAIIASNDHDEFELNHALDSFSSLFLQSYTPEVIDQYKDQPLSFNGFDVRAIFRSDRVVISDTDTLMKSMIQRLADMIAVTSRLQEEAGMLAEKQSLDGTVIMSITAMHQELISKLEAFKAQMDKFPVLSGPHFPS
ncbi:MAG: hypothetical protein Q6361_06630, partial [Candidatus Hermodarchaeota archaeon]|nr:hypothetical protein [Candidatus Hermodarchaeota archaeon]